MGINDAMQYRLNFMLGLISIIFPITIQIYIWNAVYCGKVDGVVYGFSYKQMILYTLLSAIVSKFIASDGFEGEINQDIKDGGFGIRNTGRRCESRGRYPRHSRIKGRRHNQLVY